MDNESPKKTQQSRVRDFLLLVLAGAGLAAAIFTAFLLADKLHVSSQWVLGLGSAVFFFFLVGRGYRSKLRSPTFVGFFYSGPSRTLQLFLLVVNYLGILYYMPCAFIELWAGYTIAALYVGPPPDSSIG
jgi:hypothetical protein